MQHSAVNEIYRFNAMKRLETEEFDLNGDGTRRVAPGDPNSQNRSMYREEDQLINNQYGHHQIQNDYNYADPTPIGQPIHGHYNRYGQEQMYDGGDDMEELERRRNDYDTPSAGNYYDTGDMIYSIFC